LFEFSLQGNDADPGLYSLFEMQGLAAQLPFVDGDHVRDQGPEVERNRLGVIAIESQGLLCDVSHAHEFLVGEVEVGSGFLAYVRLMLGQVHRIFPGKYAQRNRLYFGFGC
jgi:hypothetical protein